MPPINLGARDLAEMALPPTLHQEKNNPSPIDAAPVAAKDDPMQRPRWQQRHH